MKVSKKYMPWVDATLSTVIAFAITGLLYLSFINLSIFDPFSKAFHDFEFTDLYYSEMRDETYTPAKITLVNVQHEGRARIAETIGHIMAQEPKVLALDLRFRSRKDTTGDAALLAAFRKYPEIITTYTIEGNPNNLSMNDPYFEQNMQYAGFINLFPRDEQTVIRDYMGEIINDGQDTLYSFATVVANKYLSDTDKVQTTSKKGLFPINYRSSLEQFAVFDHSELDQQDLKPLMKGQIVLLGYLGTEGRAAFDVEDKHFTPVNPAFVGKSLPDMYGMVIHANVIDMLINHRPLYRLASLWAVLIAFLLSIPIARLVLEIQEKNMVFGHLITKLIQFSIPVILVYVGLILTNMGLLTPVATVIILVLMSISMIETYAGLKSYVLKKLS